MASVEDVSQDPGEGRTTNPPQSASKTIEEVPTPKAEGTAVVVEEEHATRQARPIMEEEEGFAAADESRAMGTQDNIMVGHSTDPLPGTSAPPQEEPQIGGAPESQAYYEEINHPDSAGVRYVEVQNYDVTGWGGMSRTVKEYDEEKILFCKEDIDTLLVFAGLYSAILSAFIIESYQRLQPDSGDQMVQLFQAFFAQNYTISSGFLNSTNPYPALPPFEAPAWAIRVNVLWFSSLIISLASASFGMLVKQWLREYLRMPYSSPQERLRARQFRRKALDHWRVFEIAAALPLMLELSVLLFFVGLCYFTLAVHWTIGRTTIPLVGGWAFLFIAATVAPVFSPRCPYKTTLLDSAMTRMRRITLASAKISLHFFYVTVPTLPSIFGSIMQRATTIRARAQIPEQLLKQLKLHMQEEADVLKQGLDDTELLKDVIDIVPGDGILGTVFDVFRRQKPTLDQVVDFVFHIMSRRIGEWSGGLGRTDLLSHLARDALLSILTPTIDTHFPRENLSPPDVLLRRASETFVSLVLTGNVRLSTLQRRIYARIIEQSKTDSSDVLPLINYSHLVRYTQSTLDGVEEFFTSDGELKEVVRNCLDVFLIPWSTSTKPNLQELPISQGLCRKLVEQLMKAYFATKRTDDEGQILRRSELDFRKGLFCAILVVSADTISHWTENLGGTYPSLSVVLAVRTASTRNIPEVTHLSTPAPRDASFSHFPRLSRNAKLPHFSNEGKPLIENLVEFLRPGMRGVLVDIVLYEFIFQNHEGRSSLLSTITDLCLSLSTRFTTTQTTQLPLPIRVDFCALLSAIFSLRSLPAAQSHTAHISIVCAIASKAIERCFSGHVQAILPVAALARQRAENLKKVAQKENLVVALAVVKFIRMTRKNRTRMARHRWTFCVNVIRTCIRLQGTAVWAQRRLYLQRPEVRWGICVNVIRACVRFRRTVASTRRLEEERTWTRIARKGPRFPNAWLRQKGGGISVAPRELSIRTITFAFIFCIRLRRLTNRRMGPPLGPLPDFSV